MTCNHTTNHASLYGSANFLFHPPVFEISTAMKHIFRSDSAGYPRVVVAVFHWWGTSHHFSDSTVAQHMCLSLKWELWFLLQEFRFYIPTYGHMYIINVSLAARVCVYILCFIRWAKQLKYLNMHHCQRNRVHRCLVGGAVIQIWGRTGVGGPKRRLYRRAKTKKCWLSVLGNIQSGAI